MFLKINNLFIIIKSKTIDKRKKNIYTQRVEKI